MWISNIAHRAVRIYSKGKFEIEIDRIKHLTAWIGFPKWLGKAVINKLLRTQKRQTLMPREY